MRTINNRELINQLDESLKGLKIWKLVEELMSYPNNHELEYWLHESIR